MWCARCNRDIVFCKCDDIEERLKGGLDSPAGPALAMNLHARERAQDIGLIDCTDYWDKKVTVTFESKRHNGLYKQTGKIISSDSRQVIFGEIYETNYLGGRIEYLNASRVRRIEEV